MDFTHSLIEWISHYGAISYFGLLYINGVGLPLIPAETLLMLASVLAIKGTLSLPATFSAASLGAVAGNLTGYIIGRLGGQILVEKIVKLFKFDQQKFAHFTSVINKRGAYFVIIARFIPIARELSGLLSGSLGIKFYRYILGNLIGAFFMGLLLEYNPLFPRPSLTLKYFR